jgi:predicted ATPase/DNA-binding CsgD family transcriptional regulator
VRSAKLCLSKEARDRTLRHQAMTPPASEENVSGPSPSAARDSRRRRTVDPAEVDPAPRDSKRLPHNLPLELSSFIGREREMDEIKQLLTETRLVTLTGPGGSGKTRLALKVAQDQVKEFEDGVWLVELASLSDEHLVPQTVASVLRVREQPDQSLTDVLIEHLKPKKPLLILDNCEHLVRVCARLAEALLLACPGLHILATSREPLGVSGEFTWLVPPLSAPDHLHTLSIEELSNYEAVMLFVERATAVLSSFALTDQNAPAVMEVCRKLDGMPLAIELAAARVRVLSVAQISERLERCFRLLKTDNRTALPRQRTLRATIDWSYGLLSEEEQALFRRLSVFSGGLTLGAAEEVCAEEDIEQYEILDLLSQLVDKSLVLVTEQGGEEARYRLLETVRQYGWEKLSESGEAAEVRERHAVFFLDLAERVEPAIMGPGLEARVERLEQEHDNLRTALGWLREEREAERGLRLAGALGRFWWFRGYFSEGRAQLDEFLELAGAASQRTVARAKALHTLGVLIYRSADYSAGDQEVACSRLGESVEIYRELRDEPRATAVLRELGYLSAEAGDWKTARSSLEESLRLGRQSGDEHGIALTRSYLGIMAVLRGEHDSARAHLEESLGVLRRLGELPEVKVCSFYRGLLACDEGDYATACARFAETVEDAPLLQIYRYAVPWVLQGYAQLATREGQHARALRLAGAAAALHQSLGQSVGPASMAYFRRNQEPTWKALGEQEGNAAFEEGQAMTFEEALAYALEAAPPQRGAEDTSGVVQETIEANPTVLSARELEVLKLVAEGLSDSQVAQRLYLSPRTVGHHLRRIYRKLGVSSRTAALREAARRGLI